MLTKRFVLGLTLLSLTATAATPPPQTDSGPIYTVQASNHAPMVAVGGTVVPFKEVTLAAQLPGRVNFIAGIEGDDFATGAVLVTLETSELVAKRNAANAQLAAADARLRNAGVQYSRELWSPRSRSAPGGMGMPNMLDQMFVRPAENMFGRRNYEAERSADLFAQSTLIEQARSAIFAAQAEIRAIDAKLRDAKSLAPFDGKIMHKFVEEGDTVQPGQPLLTLADVTWLQVEVDLPARLATGLKEMDILDGAATFDDHPQPTDIRVAQVFPMADAQRHTIKVKFDVPHGVSQPGMYARIKVPEPLDTGAGAMPVIPTTAIRYRGSLPVVYVQNGEGHPELRMIREGRRTSDGMTTVLSGLALGDRIYANPAPDILSRLHGGN